MAPRTWLALCLLAGAAVVRLAAGMSTESPSPHNDCGPNSDQPCGKARRTIVNGEEQLDADGDDGGGDGSVGGDGPLKVPDYIPKSGKGSLEDIGQRPWLGTLTGCLVWNPACVRFDEESGGKYSGYLLDGTDDAATNETRCLHRATEFHAWCGNDMRNRTAAVFLETGALEAYPPFGCAVWQRGCPRVEAHPDGAQEASAIEGVFFDDYDDSFMNETR